MKDWWIFKGQGTPHDEIEAKLPDLPSWRAYMHQGTKESELPPDLLVEHVPGNEIRGATYLATEKQCEVINAALYLRRPLLVTGNPGTGKTSLAYAVAYELRLGPVLVWPINTRSMLQDGLYRYDAIGRLQAMQLGEPADEIGIFIRLGPLGTALRSSRPKRPRVLLIDEIDKSDIDLPNDLLHIFEEGEFEIPELARLPNRPEFLQTKVRPSDAGEEVTLERGRVPCFEFPLVVMTSNGERDFPPAFLRRCLRLNIEPPDAERLAEIVRAHLKLTQADQPQDLITEFLSGKTSLATDQLLNAIFLTRNNVDLPSGSDLRKILLQSLSST